MRHAKFPQRLLVDSALGVVESEYEAYVDQQDLLGILVESLWAWRSRRTSSFCSEWVASMQIVAKESIDPDHSTLRKVDALPPS